MSLRRSEQTWKWTTDRHPRYCKPATAALHFRYLKPYIRDKLLSPRWPRRKSDWNIISTPVYPRSRCKRRRMMAYISRKFCDASVALVALLSHPWQASPSRLSHCLFALHSLHMSFADPLMAVRLHHRMIELARISSVCPETVGGAECDLVPNK